MRALYGRQDARRYRQLRDALPRFRHRQFLFSNSGFAVNFR